MDLNLLQDILEVCIIPLLGVLTAYLVAFIKSKSEELRNKTDNEITDKYVQMLSQTITDCVIATNQTYVEALKKDNAFTKDAQKEAFQKTYDAIMLVLTDDAKEYLTEVYGDLTAYITMKIESQVNTNKITPVG